MKPTLIMIAAAGLAASVAFAQGPGPGGKGPGKGPAWRFNADNTSGWSMMTSEERAAHRSKMLSVKSYEECVAYVEQHHKEMQARAQQRGRSLPATPRQNVCERMKQAGRFG